jgi:hypothetical protein
VSIKLMSQVWELELPHNEKLVLLALTDHANDNGFCYPSIARVAWKCDYDRRTIQRIIRRLQGRGIVTIAEPATPTRTPTYRVCLDDIPVKAPFEGGGNMTPPPHEGGRQDGAEGAAKRTGGAAPQSEGGGADDALTVSESSRESSKKQNLGASAQKKTEEPCYYCDSPMLDEGDQLVCSNIDCLHVMVVKAS